MPDPPASAQAPESAALTVIYSSSLNGNLDGCSCRSRPRAGLVKRAAWLRAYPGRSDALLLDAGDALDVQEDPDLSEVILQTYRELSYDAVAVGDQELSDGVDALRSYRERYPLASHNLVLCSDDSCLYFSLEPLLLSKGTQRVGLIALLDPEVFRRYPEELKSRLKLEPPGRTAAVLVQSLKEQGARWVVVLYHGPVEEAEKLARRVPGIQLIIVGHEQRLLPPRKIGETVIASPGEEGNRLGILTLSRDGRSRIRFRNEFRLFRYEQDPDDPAVRERIAEYRKKLRQAIEAR
jgi:2',3'-cyclic-nucleotide 2'-phosphodiesterase (5'-nucleotidase family)